MQCPHCLRDFHEQFELTTLEDTMSGRWLTAHQFCPACKRFIAFLQFHSIGPHPIQEWLVFPRNAKKAPLPKEVPATVAQDFDEASGILPESAKSSAALSRRLLQRLIREQSKITEKNLYNEIEKLIASNTIPSALANELHAIREVGNFAAHPTKDTNTGEIVEVEPGEAEWLLDILRALMDVYFVQPALAKQRKDELNKKLKAAKKNPIK
jgi:Domain of unknown function (DUF4145)